MHEDRLKEHKKCQEQGTNKDPIVPKAKKDKVITESSSSSKDEQDI